MIDGSALWVLSQTANIVWRNLALSWIYMLIVTYMNIFFHTFFLSEAIVLLSKTTLVLGHTIVWLEYFFFLTQ